MGILLPIGNIHYDLTQGPGRAKSKRSRIIEKVEIAFARPHSAPTMFLRRPPGHSEGSMEIAPSRKPGSMVDWPGLSRFAAASRSISPPTSPPGEVRDYNLDYRHQRGSIRASLRPVVERTAGFHGSGVVVAVPK